MRNRALCLAILGTLSFGGSIQAQPLIHGPDSPTSLGTYELLPDTADQTIEIFVSGGQPIQGVNLNIQIADGGPEVGGSINGPEIQSVNLLEGTIFEAKNTGLGSASGLLEPQLAFYSTTTTPGMAVTADGLLATVTIDTSDLLTGSYDLILSETVNAPTDFGSIAAQVDDGRITIIPEPMSAALIGLGATGWLTRRRGL